jgi:hypothetical protein
VFHYRLIGVDGTNADWVVHRVAARNRLQVRAVKRTGNAERHT